MKRYSVHSESLQLVVLLTLDAVFYFWVIPAGIRDPAGLGLAEGLPPSSTARLAAALIALILLLRLARLLFRARSVDSASLSPPAMDFAATAAADDKPLPRSSWPLTELGSIALCFIFAFLLLPLFGFYPAALILLAAMLCLLGERRPTSLLLLPATTTLLVYLLFGLLFSIALPSGTLTESWW